LLQHELERTVERASEETISRRFAFIVSREPTSLRFPFFIVLYFRLPLDTVDTSPKDPKPELDLSMILLMDVKWLPAEDPQNVDGVITEGNLSASLAHELPVSPRAVLGNESIGSSTAIKGLSTSARQCLLDHHSLS
jgi:hypothetical protein